MKKMILWIPVIIVAGIIIYSSAQPYTDQDLRPFLSYNFNLDWVHTYFGSVQFFYGGREVSVDFLGPAAFIEFFLRKGAHFSVFFCLGFVFYHALKYSKGRTWKTMLLSFIFIVLFAISDEIHQHFTGDRTPLVADVIVDSVGGLTGIIIAHIFGKKKKDRKRKQ